MSPFTRFNKAVAPFVLCAITAFAHASAGELLTAGEPLKLTASKAKFDFLAVDSERRRLLAAHTGNASLDVVDLDQNKLIKSVPTGAAQDSAVDAKGKRYLVSVSKPPQVAIVDAETLEVTGTVPLDGPADLLAFEPNSETAYVCHDDGVMLWIIAAANKKIVGTIKLPSEDPEGIAIEPSGKRLFQAMKTASTMAVFDLATNKMISNWPVAPAQAPHGIALVPEANAIAISGGNGKLVLMSQADGKILSSGDIPQRVDQIDYDSTLHRVYCASGLGQIAIFAVESGKLRSLGELTTTPSARSIAVDQKTHAVWIAYATDTGSFVQKFSAPQ